MIVEGELKDYIIIPIEDLISIRNDFKTNSCIINNEIIYYRNEARIQLIDDLLEKYSKQFLMFSYKVRK